MLCVRYRQITSHSFVTPKILFIAFLSHFKAAGIFRILQCAKNEKFIQITSDYDGKIEAKWHRNEIEKCLDGAIKLRKIHFQYHFIDVVRQYMSFYVLSHKNKNFSQIYVYAIYTIYTHTLKGKHGERRK